MSPTIATNAEFSLAQQREVFFSTAETSRRIRGALRRGEIRQLGPRLYTKNVSDPPDVIARRNWTEIAAGYFPGAVVVGRTALEWRPASDGSVFISPRSRPDVKLPGLVLRPSVGPGPAPGDERLFGHDIFMSSRARAFLENLRPSRARGGRVARSVSRAELEQHLERYGRLDQTSLNRLRDEARMLAARLGLEDEFEVLNGLIGTLLGTQDVPLSSRQAQATARGLPYDTYRIEQFQRLAESLLGRGLPTRAASETHELSTFSFFEAYFSNYIEGTEFTLQEAEDIVFHGVIPASRPQDAHDVLGTYQLVSDPYQRARIPQSADELIDILQSQHGRMLAGRPEVGPGRWKQRANQVGGRSFVEPHLVEGTLRESFRLYSSVPAGFARAVFAMFLVTEIHPFADGNGRMARLLTNSELTAAGQQRIIVTTTARDDYVSALRGMSNDLNVDAYTTIMSSLQMTTFDTDYSSLAKAEADLGRQNAFADPDRATSAAASFN